MSEKERFLRELREALTEQLDNESAYEYLSYYNDYIDDRVRRGEDEREVVEELGSARLIAKSILNKGKKRGYSEHEQVYDEKPDTVSAVIAGLILLVIVIGIIGVAAGLLWLVIKIVVPVIILIVIANIVLYIIREIRGEN